MARKFLYAIAVLLVLLIAGAFALRVWGDDLARAAFVPDGKFTAPADLAENAYLDPALWLSHPRLTRESDPARWRPEGAVPAPPATPKFAVFFVHPTSYVERARWNAPLDDAQARTRARTFLRGLASAFGDASGIWAPAYRQATFGAFLTDRPEAGRALDVAYGDVARAFDQFLAEADPEQPIVLAGHSQGALHVLRLLRERIAGTPLQARIAMVYPVGWPISLEHDLPSIGFPPCTERAQASCIAAWSSFAEPADPAQWLEAYRRSPGFDGQPRGDGPILCVNPVTGVQDGAAPASANLGTLKPNDDLTSGKLVAGAVPARCDERGLLLIGDPPELGPYVLPGNNYHVYDIPLFWRNVQLDVARRVSTWSAAR
jgi:hypothetical protein